MEKAAAEAMGKVQEFLFENVTKPVFKEELKKVGFDLSDADVEKALEFTANVMTVRKKQAALEASTLRSFLDTALENSREAKKLVS